MSGHNEYGTDGDGTPDAYDTPNTSALAHLRTSAVTFGTTDLHSEVMGEIEPYLRLPTHDAVNEYLTLLFGNFHNSLGAPGAVLLTTGATQYAECLYFNCSAYPSQLVLRFSYASLALMLPCAQAH